MELPCPAGKGIIPSPASLDEGDDLAMECNVLWVENEIMAEISLIALGSLIQNSGEQCLPTVPLPTDAFSAVVPR